MQHLILTHSIIRWFLLLFLIAAIILAYKGSKKSGADYHNMEKKSALGTFLFAHMQLLLGLILFFTSPFGIKNITNNGMSAVMKDGLGRFFAMEHWIGMLIAIIFITLGYIKSKKIASADKRNRKIFIFYLIALILIILSIPWPFLAKFSHLNWI